MTRLLPVILEADPVAIEQCLNNQSLIHCVTTVSIAQLRKHLLVTEGLLFCCCSGAEESAPVQARVTQMQ